MNVYELAFHREKWHLSLPTALTNDDDQNESPPMVKSNHQTRVSIGAFSAQMEC